MDIDDNYATVVSCQNDVIYTLKFNRFEFPEDDDPKYGSAVYFYRDDCFVGEICYVWRN